MSKEPVENPNPKTLSVQEEALLAILDGADPFAEGTGRLADRGDLEVLGMLARSTSAQSTSAQLASGSLTSSGKAALFERLHLAVPGAEASGVLGSSGRPEAALPFRQAGSKRGVSSSAVGGRGDQPASMGWVPLALAAAVLMAVGLGVWGGSLSARLDQSQTLVAGLESELREVKELGAPQEEHQRVVFENRRLRQQIGDAIQPRTKVCVLSSMAADQPEAKATVFLQPDEGKWVIATNSLARCELGRRYRLWFLGKDGSVMGGELLDHINGQEQVEMASGTLPDGTQALMVTLEFPDQFGDKPGGEKILYGDRSVEIY